MHRLGYGGGESVEWLGCTDKIRTEGELGQRLKIQEAVDLSRACFQA